MTIFTCVDLCGLELLMTPDRDEQYLFAWLTKVEVFNEDGANRCKVFENHQEGGSKM